MGFRETPTAADIVFAFLSDVWFLCWLVTFSLLFPSPKEIPAVGSCLRLRTADPRRADPVGPQTEGNHQQEGVPGARAGRLH